MKRKISIILLLVTIILWFLIKMTGVYSEPTMVDGVIQNRLLIQIYGGYALTVLFLFLLPFSILSLIWPKSKLWIRIIISIVLIWPIWTVMFLFGGLF